MTTRGLTMVKVMIERLNNAIIQSDEELISACRKGDITPLSYIVCLVHLVADAERIIEPAMFITKEEIGIIMLEIQRLFDLDMITQDQGAVVVDWLLDTCGLVNNWN